MNLLNRCARLFPRMLIGVLTVAALSSCSSPDPRYLPAPLTPIQQQVSITMAWRNQVGNAGQYFFQPYAIGNSVYAAGANGSVVKIDATTGRDVWRIRLKGPLSAGVGSDGELTAVGGPQGEVYLLGPDGKLLWQASAEGEIITPPLVGHGYVVVRTIDGRIVAFNAETGEEEWVYRSRRVPLNLRTTRDMIFLGQNGVLAGFSGGTLAALDLSTGNVFWQTAVSYPTGVTEVEQVNDVAGAPTWVDSRVCAVTFQGRIGCFGAQDGQPIWTHPFSSYGGLAQDSTIVASVNEHSVVSAYAASTGAKLWSNDTLKNRRLTAPLMAGNALVVGDYQGYVHFISHDTGALLGRVHTDNSGITAPLVLLGHLLIVQTRNGSLYAYRPS